MMIGKAFWQGRRQDWCELREASVGKRVPKMKREEGLEEFDG